MKTKKPRTRSTPKAEEVQVLFRAPAEVIAKLDREISRRGIATRNRWFTLAVKDYLAREALLEPHDGAKKKRRSPRKARKMLKPRKTRRKARPRPNARPKKARAATKKARAAPRAKGATRKRAPAAAAASAKTSHDASGGDGTLAAGGATPPAEGAIGAPA